MNLFLLFTFIIFTKSSSITEGYDVPNPIVPIQLKGIRDNFDRCSGKHFSCGVTVRNADLGKTVLVESPKYPSKVSCGVNCVIKIKTEPGNNITLRWKGFVLDGCHEGNKMRIVDGDQQKIYCGDKMPPTYTSSTHEIEIAMTVVNMGRDDRGVIYKFTYEANRQGRNGRNRVTGLPRSFGVNLPKKTNSPKTSMMPRKPFSQIPQISHQKAQISQQKPQLNNQQPNLNKQNQPWRNANDYAYNYDLRYRNRDSEHSSRTLGRFDYGSRSPGGLHGRFEGREIIEIIEEVENKEKTSDIEIAQPYIFMTLAVIAIIIPIIFLVRTFCGNDGGNDDIKQFT